MEVELYSFINPPGWGCDVLVANEKRTDRKDTKQIKIEMMNYDSNGQMQ